MKKTRAPTPTLKSFEAGIDLAGRRLFCALYDDPAVQLAHLLYYGSLMRVASKEESQVGKSSVKLIINQVVSRKPSPVLTPPLTPLERVLSEHLVDFQRKIQFPIRFDKKRFLEGFELHLEHLKQTQACEEVELLATPVYREGISVELYSQRLQRALYLSVSHEV